MLGCEERCVCSVVSVPAPSKYMYCLFHHTSVYLVDAEPLCVIVGASVGIRVPRLATQCGRAAVPWGSETQSTTHTLWVAPARTAWIV